MVGITLNTYGGKANSTAYTKSNLKYEYTPNFGSSDPSHVTYPHHLYIWAHVICMPFQVFFWYNACCQVLLTSSHLYFLVSKKKILFLVLFL